jgi:hypothetical protein
MNEDQAAERQVHLRAAAEALARAEAVIFINLDKDGRIAFIEPLSKLTWALHTEVLPIIYGRFPNLEPPGEIPSISSHLTWDQVQLPRGISEADIDAIIFSIMKPQWRKVAMVIGESLDRCRELRLDVSDEAFGARILELAEADRIESVGDLRTWRFSEVRLKD